MPEPIISAEFLRELDASMASEVLNGRLPYQTLAQKVQSIGFISTRIFMLGRDDINGRTFFLPTYIHPKPARADYSECSLRTEDGFVEGKVKRVPPQVVRSVLSESDLECGLKKLHEELDIEGKFSYVTPIRRGEELIGKLSMTIDSDMDQLEASEDSALILMATLLEKYVTQYLDAKAIQFQSRIANERKQADFQQVEPFITRLLSHFQDCMNGYVSSAFLRSWTDNTVFKIAENCASSIVCDRFSERYDHGRHLTGMAFRCDQTLSVVDLDELDDDQKYSVESSSYERHKTILGDNLSVLYVHVETEYSEVVFRVFNKRHEYCQSFDVNDIYLVRRLGHVCVDYLTNYWSDRAIQLLQDLSQTSITSLGNIDDLMTKFVDSLSETNESKLVFLGRQENSEQVEFAFGLPESLEGDAIGLQQFRTLRNLSKGSFWTIARVDVLDWLSKLTPRHQSLTHFHMIKISNDDLDCYLFLFVNSQSRREAIMDAISKKTQEILQIFAALVSSTLATKIRHLDIDDAKRLIGQVGHELEEPIAQYQNKALKGYLLLENKIAERTFPADVGRLLTPTIDQAKRDMDRRQNEIADMLNLAISMAQSTDTEIDVNYSQEKLDDFINEKKDFVRRKSLELHDKVAELEVSGFSGKTAVLDAKLFSKIMDNLLLNAVKYSNPPGRDHKLTVFCRYTVEGNHHVFRVENWGIPLKRHEFEAVFSPFKRGSAKDRIRSRRGMGLGLYIARRFARAHNGNVICSESTATFGDVSRRDSEGFRTVFEVKLDRHLNLGPHTIGLGR